MVQQYPFPPPSAALRNGAMAGGVQGEDEVRLTQYQHGVLLQTPHRVLENKGRGSPNKEQKSSGCLHYPTRPRPTRRHILGLIHICVPHPHSSMPSLE